jgi:hypothetical protein
MLTRLSLAITSLALLAAAAALAQDVATHPDFIPSEQLNKQLPDWLRFSGEFRARLEGFTGGGFRAGNDDDYLLTRLRINMRIQPASWLKFEFQGQDARVFWKNQRPAAPPFQNTMDLRLAYVQIGDPENKTFGLRAGRQELLLGDQRLVGNVDWQNVARSFDAVRLTLRHNGYRIDAFASTVVQAVDAEFDRPFRNKGDNLHGLYGGMEKLVPHAVVEPYVLWRVTRNLLTESPKPGNRDFKTYGVRWAGTLPGSLDYNTELAVQRGSLGSDRIAAWAGHWLAGYTVSSMRYKPRFIAEYNLASGDKNPHDGVEGTFDQLYPSGHDKYGLADQVGWRNIHDARLAVELRVNAKWLVRPAYHNYWLASATDALYAANGLPITRRTDGSAGRRVGQETDLAMVYRVNRQTQVGAGYARLFPGEFLKKTTPGHAYNYPYLMISYAF